MQPENPHVGLFSNRPLYTPTVYTDITIEKFNIILPLGILAHPSPLTDQTLGGNEHNHVLSGIGAIGEAKCDARQGVLYAEEANAATNSRKLRKREGIRGEGATVLSKSSRTGSYGRA